MYKNLHKYQQYTYYRTIKTKNDYLFKILSLLKRTVMLIKKQIINGNSKCNRLFSYNNLIPKI